MTIKVYQADVYAKEIEATVIEKLEDNSLILDRTIFFPEAGGQPCDLGFINEIPLFAVAETGDNVIHKLNLESKFHESLFENMKCGDKVTLKLDWDRRFSNMQKHCGEHILSGIFFREFGLVNRGFHMGNDYLTIDLDTPELSESMLAAVELEANKVIWNNEKVTVSYYESKSETQNLPLRKELNIESDKISVVSVGNLENPTDCVACCGTHPHFAGEVGLIKIYWTEKYKGMVRIYFDAGLDALEDYRHKHKILSELSQIYSINAYELIDKIKNKNDKYESSLAQMKIFKEKLLGKDSIELLEEIEVPYEEDMGQLIVREYEDYSTNDLYYLSKLLIKSSNQLFALVSIPETSIILETNLENLHGFSDLGVIIKEYAKENIESSGRGGGSRTSARIKFECEEDLESFLLYLVDKI